MNEVLSWWIMGAFLGGSFGVMIAANGRKAIGAGIAVAGCAVAFAMVAGRV